MNFLPQRFKTREKKEWNKVSLPQIGAIFIFSALTLFFCLTGDHWFPVLDAANLMFHEAGHPLFGMLSSQLSVYGGTIGQLFFPIICLFKFYQKGSTTSLAFSLIWFFENIFNIARYMQDARAQVLPLVGGGEHDWTEILSRWNLLQKDKLIAANISNITIVGILLTLYWLYQKWKSDQKNDH